MGMAFQVKGVQRGTTTTEVAGGIGQNGDLNVSQFLPPYAQLCAKGVVFAFDMSAGTAKAPVLTWPTTSPEWGIYNASNTKHLILIRVGLTVLSGTTGLGVALLLSSALGNQTAVTSNYASSIVTCLDGTSKSPDAYITNNPTLVGGTPAWTAFAAQDQSAGAIIGAGAAVDVGGLIVAPPKGMICAEIVGQTGTTALFAVQFIVAQIAIDLA